MPRRSLRVFTSVAFASASAVAVASFAPAQADPGPVVHPGMEIHQDANLCTIGFVDVATRTAYSAGHCHGSGPVTDRAGTLIGHHTVFRDNTPNGATVTTDHQITDWEAIALLPEVGVNDILPGGRSLVVDPGIVPVVGQPVCHFGVVTGESCGTVEAVNNGWFTMSGGVVSQRGDSGGPVYVVTGDGRAAIIGMFNSTWGQYPAAVSWQATDAQIREDVIRTASGPAVPEPLFAPPA